MEFGRVTRHKDGGQEAEWGKDERGKGWKAALRRASAVAAGYGGTSRVKRLKTNIGKTKYFIIRRRQLTAGMQASTFARPFATGRLRRTGWRTGENTNKRKL